MERKQLSSVASVADGIAVQRTDNKFRRFISGQGNKKNMIKVEPEEWARKSRVDIGATILDLVNVPAAERIDIVRAGIEQNHQRSRQRTITPAPEKTVVIEQKLENSSTEITMKQLMETKSALNHQITALKRENTALKRENAALTSKNTELTIENTGLKKENVKLEKKSVKSELVDDYKFIISAHKEHIGQLQSRLAETQGMLKAYNETTNKNKNVIVTTDEFEKDEDEAINEKLDAVATGTSPEIIVISTNSEKASVQCDETEDFVDENIQGTIGTESGVKRKPSANKVHNTAQELPKDQVKRRKVGTSSETNKYLERTNKYRAQHLAELRGEKGVRCYSKANWKIKADNCNFIVRYFNYADNANKKIALGGDDTQILWLPMVTFMRKKEPAYDVAIQQKINDAPQHPESYILKGEAIRLRVSYICNPMRIERRINENQYTYRYNKEEMDIYKLTDL